MGIDLTSERRIRRNLRAQKNVFKSGRTDGRDSYAISTRRNVPLSMKRLYPIFGMALALALAALIVAVHLGLLK